MMRATLLMLVGCFAAVPLHAQASEDSAAAAFVRRLQSAVRADDRMAVAALAGSRFIVNQGRGTDRVESQADFLSIYDRVMTRAVRSAILQQNPDSLFHNYQGYMIGRGEVWFDRACTSTRHCSGPFAFEAINLSAPPPSH